MIIDELVTKLEYNRKYAIYALKHAKSREERWSLVANKLTKKYTGGSKKFLDETISALVIIYEASDYQNSKSLVANMNMWINKAKQFIGLK